MNLIDDADGEDTTLTLKTLETLGELLKTGDLLAEYFNG